MKVRPKRAGDEGGARERVPIPPPEAGLLRAVLRRLPHRDELKSRLDEARTRFRPLDVLLDAHEEDRTIGGGILAAAIAYRLFLFLLPLAFLLISVLGLVASVFDTTPREVGRDVGVVRLITNEVASTANGNSGFWVALTALFFVAYTSRVLYRAVGIVHALAWDHSAASAKAGLRSMRLFALGLLAIVVLSLTVGALDPTGPFLAVFEPLLYGAATGCVWLGITLVLPHSTARWPNLVPGAALFGAGVIAVSAFNRYFLGYVHASRTDSYGTLGAAAAILLSLFFLGRIVVGSAVLNATLFERRSRNAPPGDD